MTTLGPIVRCLPVLRFSRAFSLSLSLLLVAVVSASGQAPVVFRDTIDVSAISSEVTVSVAITASGTGAPMTVTQGVVNGEFVVVDPGTCAGTLTASTSCSLKVAFSPKFPGVRMGAVLVKTSDKALLGEVTLLGTAKGSLAVLNPGVMSTVAGNGSWNYQGDNVMATSTAIFLPEAMVEDAAGNIYFSDTNNNRVRRVDASSGLITTVAGTGSPGFSGDGFSGTLGTVSSPSGLLVDGAGNVIFVDTGNQCVRRIDAVTGHLSTVAGMGGKQGFSGDGLAATSAMLSLPEGVAMDGSGNLYIADTGNERIRRVDAKTGVITTIAGTGQITFNGDGQLATTATLFTPWGVATGTDGSVYIADLDNNRIRKIDPSGMISTVAGAGTRQFTGDGGPATKAELNAPAAVVVDPAGNLYIADSGNSRVREVTFSTGKLNTIAGTASEQYDGDGAPANTASLYGPYALHFDQAGNLLIADMFHNRIRKIGVTSIQMKYDEIRVGKVSAPQLETLENDGNADMNVVSLGTVNAALDPATTTCAVGSLTLGTSCNLGVEFAPLTVGDLIKGSLTVSSDAGNAPDVIMLQGQVLTVNPTSVVVVSMENPSLIGDTVTFTATVSSSDTAAGGTIDFLDGTNVLCHLVPVTAMSAMCKTTALTLGSHNVTASYTGDSENAASVSPAYIQVVQQKVGLVLSAAPNPVLVTNTLTMNVTASAATGVPSGMVTFSDGTTALQTATLDAHGFASMQTSALTPGMHNLSVNYAGDATNAAGVSNVVKEEVSQGITQTMLGSSNASSTVGQAVTFTASVSSTQGLVTPTGNVTFKDGATELAKNVPLTDGVATFTLASLAPVPATHSIIAFYNGDTNDLTSQSIGLTQTVQQIATTTRLVTDVNPLSAGGTVQLTATVAMAAGATADGLLGGQVSFSSDGAVLGSATLNAQGVAVLLVRTLTVGTHALTASYVGSTNYAASTSSQVSEEVDSTKSTTGLSAGAGGALAGKAVTLTAVVSSLTGTPTGTVKFMEGSVNLGQAQLNAGTAILSLTTLSVGTHSIVAMYGGDSNYVGSQSTPLSQVITLGTPTVTLVGPTVAVNAGTPANFTVTFATDGVAPTGVLTLLDGATNIAAKTLTTPGTFTFSSSTLSVGTHIVKASYGGDADNGMMVSTPVTVTVQQAPTSTSLSSSLNPQTLGQSVTLTAQVTSVSPGFTGTVNFLDNGTVIGSGSLNNGVATYTTSSLTAGAHTLTAKYLGDTNHAESTATAFTQHIVQASQIGLSSSSPTAVAGVSVTFSAKMAVLGGTAPTGSVNFLDGGQLVGTGTLDGTGAASFATSTLAVGSHNMTASYAGDVNYSTATSSLIVQTITNANTQVVLTPSVNPATYGAPLTLAVNVTSNGGVATGTVTFLDSGVAIGSATLNAGAGALTLSTLSAGTHSLVADYKGDGRAAASASSTVTVVVKQTDAMTLVTNVNPAQTLSPVVLTATVTNAGQSVPSGQVTFTDNGAELGGATLGANGVATLTAPQFGAGNHTIVANYAGDNVDFGVTSAPLVQVVNLRPTTTTLTATTDPTNNQQLTLIGVVRWTGTTVPTGTVTFTNGSAVLGSIPVDATGVATLPIIVGMASENVVATYAGDAAYAGSASSATTIGSEPSTQFSMLINPGAASVTTGQHTTVTMTLGSLKDFSDNMSFGCLGLPFAATCTFSKTQMALKSGGTGTVQLTIDTGNPLGAGSAVNASLRSKQTGALLCFLPGMALIGLLWRRRTKFVGVLVLLVAFGMAFATTGCGGLQVHSTPAGTYKFQVTALGQNTGVSQTQTLTLTVTQ